MLKEVLPNLVKLIGSYSFSWLEAGRLASLEAQTLFEPMASQHSGLLASQLLNE
jgi:hypothetical protein